jgi:hypothetical protein
MPLLVGKRLWLIGVYHGEGLVLYGGPAVIDPEISSNPIGLIRMKKKDGTFLFNEAECERWIELILEKAKEVWAKGKGPEEKKPEPERSGTSGGNEFVPWKPTGRGKLFWIDSE